MYTIEEMAELLTVEQVRLVIGLKSTQTVYRKINKGEINAVKIGRMVRIPKSEILSLINDSSETEKGILKVGNSRRQSPTSVPQKRRKPLWEK